MRGAPGSYGLGKEEYLGSDEEEVEVEDPEEDAWEEGAEEGGGGEEEDEGTFAEWDEEGEARGEGLWEGGGEREDARGGLGGEWEGDGEGEEEDGEGMGWRPNRIARGEQAVALIGVPALLCATLSAQTFCEDLAFGLALP